jgi:hypothetical protein
LPSAQVLQVSFIKRAQSSENKKDLAAATLAAKPTRPAAVLNSDNRFSVFVKEDSEKKIHLAAAYLPPSHLPTDEHMEFILTHASAQEVERITRYVSCPTRNAFY